jgi:hypothetical protein
LSSSRNPITARASAEDADLSALFRDVFLFHWQEEPQHAILDELEWRRIDAGITAEVRDIAVDELIAPVGRSTRSCEVKPLPIAIILLALAGVT